MTDWRTMASTRTESDSFGPIEVPGDSYWGAQTERSIGNFPFGPREQMPIEIIHALGFIKQAAARVNARIGGLDSSLAEVIQPAAAEVARGDLKSQSSNDSFPTAMHIAAARAVHRRLLPALKMMHARLADQAARWASIVKIGRT